MHHAADTRHDYTTQSDYPGTGPTSLGVILLMSIKRGNNQYQLKLPWFGEAGAQTRNFPTRLTLYPLGHPDSTMYSYWANVYLTNNV